MAQGARLNFICAGEPPAPREYAMLELTAENALGYLRRQGWIDAGPAQAELLLGGVSNFVLRVTTPSRSIVLKQSRPQLRTRDAWFSDLDRIWREQEVIFQLALIAVINQVDAGINTVVPNPGIVRNIGSPFLGIVADEVRALSRQLVHPADSGHGICAQELHAYYCIGLRRMRRFVTA